MPAPLLPVLHAAVLPVDALRAWHLDPPLTVLLLSIAAGYLLARRAAARAGRALPSRWRVVAFLGGLEAVAVALMGPPDHGNAVRFSVHMAQHTLLMLVAAPLLALGQPARTLVRSLPPPALRWLAGRRALVASLRVIAHPITAFLAVVGPFVLWHYPPFYEAALRIPALHELEHASFLGGAFLFWWVLLDPFPRRRRLSATTALLLVFATWMATDLVCATVTLAPRPFYRSYTETAALWGIDPLADQRLGGAIMWVGGGGLYAVVLLVLLVRSARPGTVARRARASEPARLLFPIAVAALAVVPLVFLSLGVIAPVMARDGDVVQWEREDPQSFERRVEAFVAAYRVSERDGRPVVAPPAGGEALLVGRAEGWYPLLELQRGVEYQLVVSARDSAHGLFVDLGGRRLTVRVLPGHVAVVRIRADRAGEYPILCTELCGPTFRSMTGLVIVKE
ncbi:cytochrome c oxidase assembly protein [Thermomicrobium sp. 4228-Ro]|uniref:cytochrome c oxidase assembly protein n=1 Tax=Thermomicrobium sp. 4228-Ro TaxID=2993937 RepID=UPI002248E747|nr:cytochrome c oxidase assembly protein [Thermomicrobium sp. 4228-Ro]MCX2728373.1 cytochrome c oxidase assembly protein [Thermomicrobium sp. 4228-Ro]